MKTKFLIAVIVASLFSVAIAKNVQADDNIVNKQKSDKSIVYYFHGTVRCSSCKKIEEYTKEVFNENFKNLLEFKVVNVDESKNSHFITDYGLYTKSVVLSKLENGKEISFKNLDKIWYLLGNKNEFKNYIKLETQKFLIENKG